MRAFVIVRTVSSFVVSPELVLRIFHQGAQVVFCVGSGPLAVGVVAWVFAFLVCGVLCVAGGADYFVRAVRPVLE